LGETKEDIRRVLDRGPEASYYSLLVMPLNGNIFTRLGSESISRYDRLHTQTLPTGGTIPFGRYIVGRSERSLFLLDNSSDLHISDTLWSFAVACKKIFKLGVANVEGVARWSQCSASPPAHRDS